MRYEKLLKEAHGQNVEVYEKPLHSNIHGLYADNVIWLNQGLPSDTAKTCVLAEELGHYHTSCGDILDQNKITNIKQEKRARNWAYEKLIPLDRIISAYEAGVRNLYELAEFLDVTEYFLSLALEHYKEKFGIFTKQGDYLLYFNPLGVFRKSSNNVNNL